MYFLIIFPNYIVGNHHQDLINDIFCMIQLEITVSDLNDCVPYFDPMNVGFDVPENVEKDAVIGTIAGLDDDISGTHA